MSKPLVAVSIVVRPLAGAVHEYQTEAPPGESATLPASPAWSVAPSLVPPRLDALKPVRTAALAKLSFAGGGSW